MNLLRRIFGNESIEPLGRRGESLAANWLKQRGYQILERNFEVVDDEADLIALDPDGRTVVIVEVKTRVSETPIPELSINSKKQFRMARLAARLQRSKKYQDKPFRFDAMAVICPPAVNGEKSPEPVIRHHPAAFESPW